MNHTVTIKRSAHRGVYAETVIKLEGTRVLVIETSKRTVGYSSRAAGIHTTASVHKVEDGFQTFELFGDFHKEIAVNPDVKCTEKAVTALHTSALAGVEALLPVVVAFYAAKDGKEAEQAKPAEAVADAA